MSHKYTFSMSKTISGWVNIEAESEEEAYRLAEECNEEEIEINENDKIMGLDEWTVMDCIEVDGEMV